MNFNNLKAGFKKVVPVFALSLVMVACNSNDEGNTSSSGDNGTNTDTTANNTGVASGAAPQSMNTATPDSGTRTARRGRITAGMEADDMNSKMAVDKMGYYNRTEVAPVFAGGQAGLEEYINNNLDYPQEAIDNDVEGTVRVQFAVDEKGRITNVKTVGQKIGYGLEEEAVKVVSAMPVWTAGTVKGKGVKTWRTLPIIYKLES